MEHTKENTDTRSLPQFQVLFIVSQVIGIIAIVLTTIWSSKYWGGFGFEDANLEFNFHPPFMVALVYLCGNGILIFRGLRFKKKTPLKWIHTVFHWISLIVCGFALFTVIDFHNRKNFANFYSLHSWIGIFVSAVYFIQFFSSFVIFMIPCIPYSVRKLAMQFHVFGGLFILILLIAACVTGFTEKMLFRNLKDWSTRQPLGLYVNYVSCLLIAYGALVSWMVYITEYKRKPQFNNNSLNKSNNNVQTTVIQMNRNL